MTPDDYISEVRRVPGLIDGWISERSPTDGRDDDGDDYDPGEQVRDHPSIESWPRNKIVEYRDALALSLSARKRLLAFYVARFTYLELKEAAAMAMDRNEFFEQASDPVAMTDDAMNYVIRRGDENPERTFSVEAFEAIGYQMHDFALARTLAYMRRTGHAPQGVRAHLTLTFDDPPSDAKLERSGQPWYALDDKGETPLAADGTHRLRPFFDDRKEN